MSFLSSEKLQEKIQNIYQDFFREHDFVISSNMSLNWLPGGIRNTGNLIMISSKIPLKVFVGFKKRQKKGLEIKSVLNFEKTEEKFERNIFYSISKQKQELENFINNLDQKLNGNSAYEINILSEIPRGHGLGFSGISGALIVSGIYFLNNKIKKEEIEKYNVLRKVDIFEEIRLDSFKYEFIARYNNTPGVSSYNCFIDNNKPNVYVTENISKTIDKLKTIKYKAFSLYEKLNINLQKDLDLDYYLIFSGLKSDTFEIENSLENEKNKVNKISENIKNIFDFDDFNFYAKKLLKKDEIYERISDNLVISSVFLLNSFTKILLDNSDSNIEEFIENINKIHYSLKILNHTIEFGDLFKASFYKNKNYKQEKIGIFPMYSGKKGGGYLVVTKKEISRKTIQSTLLDIQKEYPYSYIEFNNFDYLEENKSYGIKIEQCLNKNIFSKYFKQEELVLVQDEKGNKKFLKYEEALKINSPILVDCIKRKIYLAGNKLNYKQIHSQNTTIDVLEKLYNSNSGEISNKELEFSSYRTNKNDMSGKIIYPLKKLIFEYLHIDFPLSISGTFSDYVIKLDKNSVPIIFIKKVNE